MNSPGNFSTNLKILKKYSNLSLRHFAEEAQIPKSTLQSIWATGQTTLDAHCSNVYVQVSDQVKAGDKIASIGSTGMSTGPHLHLEVIKDGIKVDPELYL